MRKLYAQLDAFDDLSEETGLACPEVTLTQQHQAEEADINTIVGRFLRTGEVPQNVRLPIEADFVDIFDFQSAQNAVRAAEDSFRRLPAAVRARFEHDPQQFVAFCTETKSDKETGEVSLANIEELRKMGLAVPKAVEPSVPAPPA